MARAGLVALLSHWRRHPLQLAMLLLGLALATALWSGVQAINAEARAAYDTAAGMLGQDRLERLQPRTGAAIPQDLYVKLRRDGWQVSPVVEGRIRSSGVRILGIDPLTLPREAALPQEEGSGLAGDLAGFLAGTRGLAHPDTVARLSETAALPGITLVASPDLPPMTVLVDIGAAQRLLGMAGKISHMTLVPGSRPGVTPLASLAPEVKRRKPEGGNDLARLTDSFHLNLTAFGFLAFAVGTFIVHSAIGLAFEQRRPMFRTLRALGLSARALTGLLIAELLALSILAGAAGVVLGYFVASALLPDVAATLGGLYGASVAGSLTIRAEWWAAGMAIAVLGTGIAAAQSLWQVWRLPILAPAQPRAWALASARSQRLQALGGLALMAMAALLYLFGTGLWAGFAVLAGMLLGAALLLPSLLSVALGWIGRRDRGVLQTWFWADTRQQLPGLSLALMALLLALATNIGVGTMVASFRATFTGWLDQRLASELYLTAGSEAEAAKMIAWLTPKTDAILPIVSADTPLVGQPGEVFGVADHATYRDNWPLLGAVPDVWGKVAKGEALLINEQLARRADLDLGDSLDLPGGPLPVAGIYSDYGNPAPQVMLSLSTFATRFPDKPPLRFALRLPPDRAEALATELRQTFDLSETALVDQATIKAFSLRVFDRTFTVTAALNVLTLGVATIAMFASLMTLSSMRLPQLAPVWAMGLTQRRLALLDFGRTLVLAVLTAVIALLLGLALAHILLAVVNVEAFGWRLPMQIFPGDWLVLAAAALLAACLAGLIPMIRLARLAPADLLPVFANER
jgi:putative ABC transport system permease protein